MNLWEIWADMIRSDQMTAAEVINFMREHPEFAAWYRARML